MNIDLLRDVAKRCGYPRAMPVADTALSQAIERYKSGDRFADIIRECRVKQSDLAKATKRLGIQRCMRKTPDQITEMRKRRDAGESLRDIAKAMGISTATVTHYTTPLIDKLRAQVRHEERLPMHGLSPDPTQTELQQHL